MKSIILFYEKPGCATNARQKELLRAAGCLVIERNLLDNGMSEEELRGFFEEMPVNEWFNPNAPDIKKGLLDPYALDEQRAVAVLLTNPILIRRPLIVLKEQKMCGFDTARIEACLGVQLSANSVESCSAKSSSCNS